MRTLFFPTGTTLLLLREGEEKVLLHLSGVVRIDSYLSYLSWNSFWSLRT